MINTEKSNTSVSMDDIVFEIRNKSYGAYQLRKSFSRNFVIAMLFSASFTTLLFFSPNIYKGISSLFGADKDKDKEKEQIVEAFIEDIPLDPETPPPPAVEIPPPKVEMIKFLPPEIKPDIEIKKEEIPPTQDELEEKKNIGAVTQDGDTSEMLIVDGPSGNAIVDDGGDDMVYTAVEEDAEFPGGAGAMYKFLQQKMVYPKKAEKMGISGKVVVYFEIDKEGNVTNVKIHKGFNEEFDNEALRVVNLMPKWKAAKQNGRTVRVRRIIPIKFQLPED
jgi:protein TonB